MIAGNEGLCIHIRVGSVGSLLHFASGRSLTFRAGVFRLIASAVHPSRANAFISAFEGVAAENNGPGRVLARVRCPRAGFESGYFQPLHLLREHPEGFVELRIFPDAFDLPGLCPSGRNPHALFCGMGRKYIS